MTNIIRNRAAGWLFILLCSAGALCSIARIQGWGNDLSAVDRFSEANALREVRNFREFGLTQDYGLGRVFYPGMYSADGYAAEAAISKGPIQGVSPDGVYTHYPPGSEYLLYIAEKLFGPEPVSCLRLLPISIGWAATIFLGLAVHRRFGTGPAWLVMGMCALTPVVTDGFVGLHSQGYAAALMMLEIGVAIGRGISLAPFALLGFLQGWLSFDYVFLVTFAPLALDVVMPKIDLEYRRRWKLAFIRAVLAGGGFACAHAAHFLQVWAYWGSFAAAFSDFAGAAAHRAGVVELSGIVEVPMGHTYLQQALGNLKVYFYGLHPFSYALTSPEPNNRANWDMFRFLGLSLGPWWLLVTVGLIVLEKVRPHSVGRSARLDWHSVCLAGIMTSSLWLVVMVNHAGTQRYYLFRGLFFAFFVMVLFGAVRFCHQLAGARVAAVCARMYKSPDRFTSGTAGSLLTWPRS
jgi:hypothetical protein